MLVAMILSAALAADTTATKIDALPSRPEAPASAAVEAVPEAPASVAGIRPLLGARHTDDLPTQAALDTHGDAAAALRWIASHSQSLVEAERAADLLALYPSADNARFCGDLLSASDVHAKIRSGGARCLQSQQLDAAAQQTIVKTLSDADPRVGIAAADVVKARPELLQTLDLSTLPQPIQARLGGK
ncbi:MAG: hypothetical protein CMJ34_13285 [Phycisphaerae bacterium]|nr:hypothetical protein [Phycisphaerae bacterium]